MRVERLKSGKGSDKSCRSFDAVSFHPSWYAPLDRVEFREGSEVLLGLRIKDEDAVPTAIELLLWGT